MALTKKLKHLQLMTLNAVYSFPWSEIKCNLQENYFQTIKLKFERAVIFLSQQVGDFKNGPKWSNYNF